MQPSKRISFALVSAIACFAGSVAGHAITITANSMSAASNSTAGFNGASFSGTSIPTGQLLDATAGDYFSRTKIDYTGSGNQVTLLNTFDQKRSGLPNNYSNSEGLMNFTADANTTYNLSGFFTDSDVSTAGLLYFESYLLDITSSTTLAYSIQRSEHTLNESFILGGSGGDSYDFSLGALSGSIISGHQYQWYFYTLTDAYPDADGGATATGYLKLDIGGGAPSSSSVPDSGSTIALMGVAFLGLGLIRRKLAA